MTGRKPPARPKRAGLLRETTTRADEELAADPDQTIKFANKFFRICEELSLGIDYATLATSISIQPTPATPRLLPTLVSFRGAAARNQFLFEKRTKNLCSFEATVG